VAATKHLQIRNLERCQLMFCSRRIQVVDLVVYTALQLINLPQHTPAMVAAAAAAVAMPGSGMQAAQHMLAAATCIENMLNPSVCT
jgi:hypothetical protein